MAGTGRKRRRRDRGEDSIYQRKSDHRWICEIRNGFKLNGRPDIIYLTAKGYPDTTRENKKLNTQARNNLLARRDEVKAKLHQGIEVDRSRLKVAEYIGLWLESAKKSKRATTWASYESVCRVHIVPNLGRKFIAKLTPADVEEMMSTMAASGVSPTTVKNARTILRKILNDAMRAEVVTRNVVTLTDPPKQEPFQPRPFKYNEIPVFLEAAKHRWEETINAKGESELREVNRLEALWVLFLNTGLRAGEAYGLRWQDVDLEGRSLRVDAQIQRIGTPKQAVRVPPKTERSRSPIRMTATLVEALKAHRERQTLEIEKAGSRWLGHQWEHLVFCTSIGTPLDPSNVLKEFREVLSRAGLDQKTRIHDLRHTCGTMLARLGVNPRVAQEILRHSQISMTLGLYTHVEQESLTEAADLLDSAMSQGTSASKSDTYSDDHSDIRVKK